MITGASGNTGDAGIAENRGNGNAEYRRLKHLDCSDSS